MAREPGRARGQCSLPAHARTLRRIAASEGRDFYEGDLAAQIAGFAAADRGHPDRGRPGRPPGTWVEPIGSPYRDYEVWEIPPNGQGIAALGALKILEGLDLRGLPRELAESYHLQIEAMKLAFADAQRYVADPAQADVPCGACWTRTTPGPGGP